MDYTGIDRKYLFKMIKSMLRVSVALAVLVSGLAFSSCSDKDPEVVPSPCETIDKDKLFFTVSNKIYDRFFESDTIFPGKVQLTASGAYTDVKWQLGSDPRIFTGNNFTISFPDGSYGTIPIRLIGTRSTTKACSSKDDGVDTLTKSLTVMPLVEYAPKAAIEGKFQGATTDAPRDTFTVRIYTAPDPLYPSQSSLHLVNLNKGCPGTSIDISAGYKGILFNQTIGTTQCRGIHGIGYLDPIDRNTIHFEYEEQLTPGSPTQVKRSFTGKRIR